ncbi:putative membrane protein [Candidatus Rubidus massiliensis]|nr:putative membrane protein [Candidatus Rubidus massiliensis]
MKFLFLFCFISFGFVVFAHEGHQEQMQQKEHVQEKEEGITEKNKQSDIGGRPLTWLQWIGTLHLIFLHFPIALINMVAISELLFALFKKPMFEIFSRFMLIAAAIIAPPTALLGLIYSYSATYNGLMETFLWWHMWFGISTAIFTIAVTFTREYFGVSRLYYSCVAFLFLMINITGFFGGGMTFGPYHMHPPL